MNITGNGDWYCNADYGIYTNPPRNFRILLEYNSKLIMMTDGVMSTRRDITGGVGTFSQLFEFEGVTSQSDVFSIEDASISPHMYIPYSGGDLR